MLLESIQLNLNNVRERGRRKLILIEQMYVLSKNDHLFPYTWKLHFIPEETKT